MSRLRRKFMLSRDHNSMTGKKLSSTVYHPSIITHFLLNTNTASENFLMKVNWNREPKYCKGIYICCYGIYRCHTGCCNFWYRLRLLAEIISIIVFNLWNSSKHAQDLRYYTWKFLRESYTFLQTVFPIRSKFSSFNRK